MFLPKLKDILTAVPNFQTEIYFDVESYYNGVIHLIAVYSLFFMGLHNL